MYFINKLSFAKPAPFLFKIFNHLYKFNQTHFFSAKMKYFPITGLKIVKGKRKKNNSNFSKFKMQTTINYMYDKYLYLELISKLHVNIIY